MKKINLSSSGLLYNDMKELSEEDYKLMESAIEATQDSYSPYSKFKVGAAILLKDGNVITGSNQENAAYPSGMCAERVAIWKVATSYPNQKIKKIAITAKSSNKTVDKPVGPCGACRQTMLEYELNQQAPVEVLFMGEVGKVVKVESITSLLPFSFDSSYL